MTTFPSSFPLCLFFPYVPINLFPRALLHTRLVHSNYGRAVQPPAHTLCTHSPHSLSLYQLGINLLKQRASWRAAHRGACEELPLRRSTLPTIPRVTHSSSLLPTAMATKQIRDWGDRRKHHCPIYWVSGEIKPLFISVCPIDHDPAGPAESCSRHVDPNIQWVTDTGCRVSAGKTERKMSSKIN